MSSDSSTGGHLPLGGGLTARAQEDALHDTLAALAGLPGAMVRPRWQPSPPRQPASHEDWCAFGTLDEQPQGHQLVHGDDAAVLHAESRLAALASFYGPGAAERARAVRLGLGVAQNRAALAAVGLVAVEAGAIVQAAALVGQTWVPRYDLAITLRRGDTVAVPIRNLAGLSGTLSDGATGVDLVRPTEGGT